MESSLSLIYIIDISSNQIQNMKLQNWCCRAWESVATMWVRPLVGLILCLAKTRRVLQSTDRRTPYRLEQRKSCCCTGKNSPPLLSVSSRSGAEWLAGEEGKDALLKAPIGLHPNEPPYNGWQFNNKGNFEEDESLICSSQPESPCCSITVSLSGAAKKGVVAFCGGMYKSTGLISMGRLVLLI